MNFFNKRSSELSEHRKRTARHLKADKEKILEIWEIRARESIEAAEAMTTGQLRNSLPQFIDALSAAFSSPISEDTLKDFEESIANKHGDDRSSNPAYDLIQIIDEYQILRHVIVDVLRALGDLRTEDQDMISDAIHIGIRGASDEFIKQRREFELMSGRNYHRVSQNLRLVVESVSDHAIIQTDQEGKILSWNTGAEKIFGFGRDEVLGLPASVIFTREDLAERADLKEMHLARETGRAEDQRWHVKKGGARFFAIGVMNPLKGDTGELLGYVKVLRDGTETKQNNDALQESLKLVERTVGELKHERELREHFVTALAHDLRTPITAAKMSIQASERAPTRERGQMFAKRAINSIDRCERMIRDLLDANTIKAGDELSIEPSECHLNEILNSTVSELASIHGERFIIRADKPIYGVWDCSHLRRVIENLANNAIKYGAPQTPVTLTLIERQNEVEISVHNEGNPIPPEDQKIIFERSKRAPSAKQSGEDGWGIGLTLVQGITRAHGGKTFVESHPNKGTTFHVVLPERSRVGLL